MKTNRLPNLTNAVLCIAMMAAVTHAAGAQPADSSPSAKDSTGRAENLPAELAWPPVTKECRPWTYWHWLGSAVNKADLTRNLELYRQAGMGGMHIVHIYGAKGCEEKYIDYLTPKWMQMLAHTVTEAKRLDLGVDMTSGTAWPFGGPWVSSDDAAAEAMFKTYTVAAGGRVEEPIHRDPFQIKCGRTPVMIYPVLHVLMAFADDGRVLDLTAKVDEAGRLDWQAPTGKWTLHAVFQRQIGKQVKHVAPGDKGNVVDYLSTESLMRYLGRFDNAFAGYKADMVRAFYHDSFEVRPMNWTDDMLSEFQRRRGYDLRKHLPALQGKGNADRVSRVKSDFYQTISEMMLDRFTIPWVRWAHQKGAITRNQAHGSPGNILDLYAAADIPATEAYGTGWLDMSGAGMPPGIPRNWGGRPHLLANKFASSAAHVAGKPLVACESCTWLSEHFQVSLAQVKAQIDVLFTAGVNHVFFAGMTYSPEDAGWPGWMFYAATNFGPSNTFYRDLPELNAYIARCQSVLQAGRPDSDVLLYFPIYDLWIKEHERHYPLHYLQVHNSNIWLKRNLAAHYRAAKRLWDRGWGFDFVSDRMLKKDVSVSDNRLEASGTSYRVLALAGCSLMPPETLDRIVTLARDGATVLVVGELPSDVPGLSSLAERRRRLKRLLEEIGPGREVQPGIRRADLDQGRFFIGKDLEAMLQLAGVRREAVVDHGVGFIRRVHRHGWDYFLTNPGKDRLDGWITPAVEAASAAILDPHSGRRGMAATRQDKHGRTEVYLQLEPGESLILRALRKPVDGPRWTYLSPAGRKRSREHGPSILSRVGQNCQRAET